MTALNDSSLKNEDVPLPLPPRRHAKPLVKWAGAKRWLVPIVSDTIYGRLKETEGRYVEPFLGGGAIALELGLPRMILGDSCRPLIEMYQAIRTKPRDVAWALKALAAQGTDRESYLAVRQRRSPSPILAAAQFIYLNKLGFNGLYRVNRSGQFNVPYGDAKRGERAQSGGVFPTEEEILAVAAALADSDLAVRDFRQTIALAGERDVIYADPPYLATYSNYTAEGFTQEDHEVLATALRRAALRGAVVIATNSDTPEVRKLYDWAFTAPVIERHSVGATVARRGAVRALLIASQSTITDLSG